MPHMNPESSSFGTSPLGMMNRKGLCHLGRTSQMHKGCKQVWLGCQF
jgi:hypothetical protein